MIVIWRRLENPKFETAPPGDLILKLTPLNVSNILEFLFPRPPNSSRVSDSLLVLPNLGCLIFLDIDEDEGRITNLELKLGRLPLGLRYTKMMAIGSRKSVLPHVIVVN